MDTIEEAAIAAAKSSLYRGPRYAFVENNPPIVGDGEDSQFEKDLSDSTAMFTSIFAKSKTVSLSEDIFREIELQVGKYTQQQLAILQYVLIASNTFPLRTIESAHLDPWKIQQTLIGVSKRVKFLSFVNDTSGKQKAVFPYICIADLERVNAVPIHTFVKRLLDDDDEPLPPLKLAKQHKGATATVEPMPDIDNRVEEPETVCAFLQNPMTRHRGYFMILFPSVKLGELDKDAKKHKYPYVFFQEVFVAQDETFMSHLRHSDALLAHRKFWNVTYELTASPQCISLAVMKPIDVMRFISQDTSDVLLLPCSPESSENIVTDGNHIGGHFMKFNEVQVESLCPATKKTKRTSGTSPVIFPFYYPSRLADMCVSSHFSSSMLSYMQVQSPKVSRCCLDKSVGSFVQTFDILRSGHNYGHADVDAIRSMILQLIYVDVPKNLKLSVARRMDSCDWDINLAIPLSCFTTEKRRATLATMIQYGILFASVTQLRYPFYVAYLVTMNRLNNRLQKQTQDKIEPIPAPCQYSITNINHKVLKVLFSGTIWRTLSDDDRVVISAAFKVTAKSKPTQDVIQWVPAIDIKEYGSEDAFSGMVNAIREKVWVHSQCLPTTIDQNVGRLVWSNTRSVSKSTKNKPCLVAKTPFVGKVTHQTLSDEESDTESSQVSEEDVKASTRPQPNAKGSVAKSKPRVKQAPKRKAKPVEETDSSSSDSSDDENVPGQVDKLDRLLTDMTNVPPPLPPKRARSILVQKKKELKPKPATQKKVSFVKKKHA